MFLIDSPVRGHQPDQDGSQHHVYHHWEPNHVSRPESGDFREIRILPCYETAWAMTTNCRSLAIGNLNPLTRNNWRSSLVPAAAVIPASIAYIKVVAVIRRAEWDRGLHDSTMNETSKSKLMFSTRSVATFYAQRNFAYESELESIWSAMYCTQQPKQWVWHRTVIRSVSILQNSPKTCYSYRFDTDVCVLIWYWPDATAVLIQFWNTPLTELWPQKCIRSEYFWLCN